MGKTIKQPTLFFRTGYFIDNLKYLTNLGFKQIERRVRENQYENQIVNPSLLAPSEETVRDYFRLYRSVAFEPDKEVRIAPWLLAAELEFPGSSSAFFHPIFDLLFGELESSVFWSSRFRRIPEDWITKARTRGDSQIAHEWELMNQSTKSRKHRSKPSSNMDRLSFVHLSLLRLPPPIRDVLFDGNGSGPNWTRKYSSANVEIGHLQTIHSMESLAAMLALMMESAEIGDVTRFDLSRKAFFKHMSFIDSDPACTRIKDRLKKHLIHMAANLSHREYNGFVHFGFGLPVSWRVMELEKFLPKPPVPAENNE
ncbi:hypothetical protein [Sideroxydans lithotrophicus]|uniref:Uncharacterized protein n=1 Tax=Sideroxydans lithotrophicus (strain ES-1) TaxID=580332 RepID=D5CQU5_SIDLE|nr:hypothetical protein [Sideroxydans lithotrophicus]ADE11331.1 hypothetical protein Slit_1093 [Sideroxydans lithotrophicus ES-1]